MATHIALLRGINVGGRNKLTMADLRAVVASLGHADVVTYIQSGNVVFTAPEAVGGGPDAGPGTGQMAAALARAIAEATGVAPGVVVLTRGELAKVVRDNPYPDAPNPRYVHAVFLPEPPGPEAEAQVAALVQRVASKGSRDTAQLAGRTLFLHTPDGFGRSELAERLLAGAGSPVAAGTARNWATVTKLLALCET